MTKLSAIQLISSCPICSDLSHTTTPLPYSYECTNCGNKKIKEEPQTTECIGGETILPRRIQLDKCTPAELAIQNAVWEVEKMGADVRLTNAVILLSEARDQVADFVDGVVTESESEKIKRYINILHNYIGVLKLELDNKNNRHWDIKDTWNKKVREAEVELGGKFKMS